MEVEKDQDEYFLSFNSVDLENIEDLQSTPNHFVSTPNLESEDNILICETCSKKFTKLKNLKKHLKLHSSDKPYKCNQCEMSYSRSDHLQRHSVTHSQDSKPFPCDMCIQRFSNKSHLIRHLKNIHNDKDDKNIYKCDKCEMSFNKKHKMSKHTSLMHSEIKSDKYKCYYPFCHKVYHSKGKLECHIEKVHEVNELLDNTNNEIYELKDLSEMIKEEVPLKNEKKYLQCPFESCYKTYTTSYNLKVHIKTFHYKVEEFICNYEGCNQSFKHKCSLERHLMKLHKCNSNITSNSSSTTLPDSADLQTNSFIDFIRN